MDSRFCGNDVMFGRAAGGEESGIVFVFSARFLAEFTLSAQSQIPSLRSGQALRAVYPERSERAQDDSEGPGMTASPEIFQ
jgi:hypothetical protein